MLERWTRAVIRFRFVVLACWLAVAAVGTFSSVRLPALLSTSLAVPGTSSEQADTTLVQHFAENPQGTFTVVFRTGSAPARTAPRGYPALTQRVVVAARALPGAHAMPLRTAPGIVYGNVVTGLDLQDAERYTDTLRRALARPAGRPTAPSWGFRLGSGLLPAFVTGAPAIQHDLNPILAADLRRGEIIAVPVALLILAVVLGVRAVLLVPLVFAGSTITAALAIIYAMAHVFLMVSYVPNLVELIGLGLAIDYSLLFVHRFQEEVANEDRSVDDAIVRTMVTAGRAVFFSGIAVAIGLSVVLIVPVPFIHSMGIAGVVLPIVSIVAALTLQPALLSLLGRGGLHGGRLPGFGRARGVERRLWTGLARTVMRRRLTVLAGAAVVLAALAAPVVWLQLTPGSISTIPQFTESARGLILLRDRIGSGAITPIEVVVDGGAGGRARTPATSAATLRLARRLLQDREVFIVAIGSKAPYVDSSGRYLRVVVVARHEFGDEASQQLVTRLRQQFIPAAHFPAGFDVSTGGAPAQGVDFLTRVYGTFPWIVLAVLLLAYVVLLRAFRSLILPLMAVLLDVISVAATYGLLVLIFQFGVGARLLGFFRVAQIEGWIPAFLFATLFGLSMDYQVFLVTRMRESWDRGADNAAAVARGLERTGRIVSAAAVVMVASFSGFMAGRVAGLQELGTGLALGVLLDATVVRILLMPSLMALFGRWNWWLPAAIARLMRVEASPLTERKRRDLSKSA
jgi:RND superfamily putative drug exporter